MKITHIITLTAIAALTAACGDNVESAIDQTSNIVEKASDIAAETGNDLPALPSLAELENLPEEALSTMTSASKSVVSAANDELNRISEATAKPLVEDASNDILVNVTEEEEQQEVKVAAAPATENEAKSTITSSKYIEGTHYDVLDEPIEVNSENIQVSELFWYGCGHCFQLEPTMKKFRANLPAGTDFVEVPAIFGSQWRFHAQAFYTAQALGIQEETHEEIFNTIHLKKKRLATLAQLQDLFEKHGQDKDTVASTFKSFAIDSNLRSASLFAQKSGATSVPTLIVDGKYRTSLSKVGSKDKLLELLAHLVEKAKAER